MSAYAAPKCRPRFRVVRRVVLTVEPTANWRSSLENTPGPPPRSLIRTALWHRSFRKERLKAPVDTTASGKNFKSILFLHRQVSCGRFKLVERYLNRYLHCILQVGYYLFIFRWLNLIIYFGLIFYRISNGRYNFMVITLYFSFINYCQMPISLLFYFYVVFCLFLQKQQTMFQNLLLYLVIYQDNQAMIYVVVN